MTRIRCVIVDDEELARERIRSLLLIYDDVETVGEYGTGAAALRELAAVAPDLIFLDVQMPGIDGFSLLQAMHEDERPAVIFVTAYDEHAIRAFEVDALDYLLKPFTKERFARTMDRVRARFRSGGDLEYRLRLSQTLKRFRSAQGLERLPIKTEQGTSFLPIEDLDWAEADGNYVQVHTGRNAARMRETIEGFCDRLPAERFIRIHRSIVVNVERIVRVEPWTHGEFVVVLRDGTKLKSGRAYSEVVRALLR
jgi:two-component system LytT family response regulator